MLVLSFASFSEIQSHFERRTGDLKILVLQILVPPFCQLNGLYELLVSIQHIRVKIFCSLQPVKPGWTEGIERLSVVIVIQVTTNENELEIIHKMGHDGLSIYEPNILGGKTVLDSCP